MQKSKKTKWMTEIWFTSLLHVEEKQQNQRYVCLHSYYVLFFSLVLSSFSRKTEISKFSVLENIMYFIFFVLLMAFHISSEVYFYLKKWDEQQGYGLHLVCTVRCIKINYVFFSFCSLSRVVPSNLNWKIVVSKLVFYKTQCIFLWMAFLLLYFNNRVWNKLEFVSIQKKKNEQRYDAHLVSSVGE